jgi:hypothetical protein
MPNRLDISSTRPATDLDMALGFAIHDDHDDNSVSIGSPSVETAVTGNIGQITPHHDHPIKESRESRSRSDSSGRDRKRRPPTKIARRETTYDPPRVAMGGLGLGNEIMRDVTDSVRQIFTAVRRFGPEERDAVRETLLDAGIFVSEKVRETLFPSCGCADDVDVRPDIVRGKIRPEGSRQHEARIAFGHDGQVALESVRDKSPHQRPRH